MFLPSPVECLGIVARDYGIPCVVAGFEPTDILQCVDMLVTQG